MSKLYHLVFVKHLLSYILSENWSRKYPFLKHKANVPLFASVVLSRANGTDKELFALFKLTHLIFYVDDVYDDRLFDTDGLLDELFGQRKKVVTNKVKANFIRFFDDCVNGCCQLFDEFGQENFKKSVYEMIKAMEVEAAPDPEMSKEEYLENGKKSVGLYMYNTALLSMAKLKSDSKVDRILELSAKFIRLSNDIRSYYREQGENKVNLLVLTQRDGVSLTEAAKKVTQLKTSLYKELYELECPREELSIFKASVLRYIDFIDQFYKIDGEFRDAATSSKEQLKLLLAKRASSYGKIS